MKLIVACPKNQTKTGITVYDGPIIGATGWRRREIEEVMKFAEKKAKKDAIDWANANGCPDGCVAKIKSKVKTSFVGGVAYVQLHGRDYLRLKVEWTVDYDCVSPNRNSRYRRSYIVIESAEDIEIQLRPGRYYLDTDEGTEEESEEESNN